MTDELKHLNALRPPAQPPTPEARQAALEQLLKAMGGRLRATSPPSSPSVLTRSPAAGRVRAPDRVSAAATTTVDALALIRDRVVVCRTLPLWPRRSPRS